MYTLLRGTLFAAFFISFTLWEKIKPASRTPGSDALRYFSNLAVVALNNLAVMVFPLLPVVLAGERADGGILSMLPSWGVLKGILGFLFLDLIIYLQHWAFHRVPLFWRVHRMHHSDKIMDVTTALRFHPFEILLSLAIKLGAVWIFGVSELTVVLFEVILNSGAMFNHSNIHIPSRADRLLRLFLVTPDMHLVHHSVDQKVCHSNYGFFLSVWDRIFRNYRFMDKKQLSSLKTGVRGIDKNRSLWELLITPFYSGEV